MTVAVSIERRSGGLDQDRAGCWCANDRCVFALADGAGGTAGGTRAAEQMLREAQALHTRIHRSPMDALDAAELALSRLGGQSTGIVVELSGGFLLGASAGDSRAWLLGDVIVELTRLQRRRPLIGDGALPVAFGPLPFRERLLIASDGLFDYAHAGAIVHTARDGDLASCARALVELPRLADGSYPDDVAVVLAEPCADAQQP